MQFNNFIGQASQFRIGLHLAILLTHVLRLTSIQVDGAARVSLGLHLLSDLDLKALCRLEVFCKYHFKALLIKILPSQGHFYEESKKCFLKMASSKHIRNANALPNIAIEE